MADTTFVDGAGSIDSSWLNDVNRMAYSVADKAAAALLQPVDGLNLAIKSADGKGSLWRGVTGAAPGAYADDGGILYCGKVFIPIGGDGSEAWIKDNEASIDPEEYGAIGDGVTDDTAALQAAATALPNNTDFVLNKEYLISGSVSFTDKSGFNITGGGTLKAANGFAVVSGNELFVLTRCSQFSVNGITVDGNRTNRTPAEVSAHNIWIRDCHYFKFTNCKSKNAVVDGIYIASSTPSDKTTHSSHFSIENQENDNCYRQGCSIIEANNFIFLGGDFSNTNGTAPEAGIDLESNAANPLYSIEDGLLINTKFSGNAGYGLLVSSVKQPRNIVSISCKFYDNVKGAIDWGAISGKIIDPHFDGADNNITRGVIDVPSNSQETQLNIVRPIFRNISTTTVNLPLVYVHSTNTGHITISDIDVDACSTAAMLNAPNCVMTGGVVKSASADSAVQVVGENCEVSDITFDKGYRRSIHISGANAKILRNKLLDQNEAPSGAIHQDTTASGLVIDDNIIEVSTPFAGIGIRLQAGYDSVKGNTVAGITGNEISLEGAAITEVVGFRNGNIGNGVRLVENIRTETATNFKDITAAVNTLQKQAGQQVWDSTNLQNVWAAGGSAGSVWVDGSGTTVHTPV